MPGLAGFSLLRTTNVMYVMCGAGAARAASQKIRILQRRKIHLGIGIGTQSSCLAFGRQRR